ncbi:MAG: DMT family transporter [Alphaproteobacteria bacterium]|jgi:drug/metabolite transporter (DMT)-like permease|nr:DMT family transporter [Alphaproteobacteria bacterium]MBT4083028.1 DMT family transporter [Alphaproteobacteria bacterium]MBT4543055.1 DMT family transporter [Alphaproteobacteria bacterium]MBT7746664.1 DMT family transporter [Alphaproteobacteria bacterium]
MNPAAGLAVTVVMWGTMVPFIAALLKVVDPWLLSLLRYGFAMLFLLGMLWINERRGLFAVSYNWKHMLALGASMAGFSTFYALGILYSDPVTAAIVLTANPVVAAILSRFLYQAKLPKGFLLALVLAVSGGIVVVRGSPQALAGNGIGFQGGEILLLMAVSCWTWYSLKVQDWCGKYSNIRTTTITSATAIVWLALVWLFFLVLGDTRFEPEALNIGPVSMLIWLSWGAAGIAIILWHRGAAHIGVPSASLYLNLIPVVAVIVSAVLFDLRPNMYQIGGGLLVLSGVMSIQLRRLGNDKPT